MAFDANSKQNSSETKETERPGSSSSSAGSLGLSPSRSCHGLLSPSSLDYSSVYHGLETCPRLAALDLSHLPRVHSTRRIPSIETDSSLLSSEEILRDRKPDLINDTPHECPAPKLSAPGSSVIVTDNAVYHTAEPEPLPVVDPERLCPYPAEQIVVVKEGPVQVAMTNRNDSSELTQSTHPMNPLQPSYIPDIDYPTDAAESQTSDFRFKQKSCQCGAALESGLQTLWRRQARAAEKLSTDLEVCEAARKRWEKEATESAHEAAGLRVRVHELELDLATRVASLQSLKAKVAQQHVDATEQGQQHKRLERDSSAVQLQLDEARRSEKWYRDQLHACQAQRAALQQELMAAQEKAARQTHRADRLESCLERQKDRVREITAQQLGGKRQLVRQLELVAQNAQQQGCPSQNDTLPEQVHLAELNELRHRVSDLEVSLESARSGLSGAERENERLLGRLLELQRGLSDCKQRLQAEEDRCRSAETDRDCAQAALRARELALSELSSKHAALAARLETTERARSEAEEGMATINRNFFNVSSQYRALKAEVQTLRQEREERECRGSELGAELNALSAEREQLQAQLGEQRERNALRLTELLRTIQTLEAEMRRLQVRQADSGDLRAQIDALTASLEDANARANSQAGSLRRDMERLRMQNAALLEDKATLLRARQELGERVDQLSAWLEAVSQGQLAGQRQELRDRLSALRASPVQLMELEAAGDAPCGDAAGDHLLAANRELALHVHVLQRRLAAVLENAQGRVDVSSDGRPDLLAQAPSPPETLPDDLRCLRALLEVCLLRAQSLPPDLHMQVQGQNSPAHAPAHAAAHAADLEPEADPDLERVLERVLGLLGDLGRRLEAHWPIERQGGDAGDSGDAGDVGAEVLRLEQELASAHATIKELHKQLFSEKRDVWQLRKDVSSLRMGLETANDMLDNNKIALGRSEAYGQVLEASKAQLEARLEAEQREHEDCRTRAERLTAQLQEAQAKDPLLAAQMKTLSCHLHQRNAELRALQERLELRESEYSSLRAQLSEQREAAQNENERLQSELLQAQQDLARLAAFVKGLDPVLPSPAHCDDQSLKALMERSNQLPHGVMAQLQTCVDGLKAEVLQLQKQQQLDGACNGFQPQFI